MTLEQIEQRLASIERTVSHLSGRLDSVIGSDPKSKWWEQVRPMSDEARQAWEESAPYRLYIRQTGQAPPPEWKPGDPIPEPDHWK